MRFGSYSYTYYTCLTVPSPARAGAQWTYSLAADTASPQHDPQARPAASSMQLQETAASIPQRITTPMHKLGCGFFLYRGPPVRWEPGPRDLAKHLETRGAKLLTSSPSSPGARGVLLMWSFFRTCWR